MLLEYYPCWNETEYPIKRKKKHFVTMPWKVISLEVKEHIILCVEKIVSSPGIFKIPYLNKQSLVITYMLLMILGVPGDMLVFRRVFLIHPILSIRLERPVPLWMFFLNKMILKGLCFSGEDP